MVPRVAIDQAMILPAQLLKAVGFKRRGTTYFRHGDGFAHIINLQSSQWNSRNLASFTFNLGVYELDLAAALGRAMARLPENVFDCMYSERVGWVVPRHGDLWWEISEKHSAEEVGGWVHGVLSEFVLPWFAACMTRGSFVEVLSKRGGWGVIDVLWRLEEKQLALQALENLDHRMPNRDQLVRQWKLDHGVGQ